MNRDGRPRTTNDLGESLQPVKLTLYPTQQAWLEAKHPRGASAQVRCMIDRAMRREERKDR